MNMDSKMEINRGLATLIFYPETIKKSARGEWAGTEVEIVDINGDSIQIRRVAADQSGYSGDVAGVQPGPSPEDMAFKGETGAKNTDKGGGGTLTNTVTGPVEPKTLYPGLQQGGWLEDFLQYHLPKLPHPAGPWGDNESARGETPNNEVKHALASEAVEILNAIKKARIRDGIDKPIFATKES